MKFRDYLQEIRYFKKVKSGMSYMLPGMTSANVIVNPSPEELEDKEYHYLIDLEEKNVYIWHEGHVSWNEVGKEILKNRWNEDEIEKFTYGQGDVVGNKIVVYPTKYEKKIFSKAPWLKKYFKFIIDEEYVFGRKVAFGNEWIEVFVNPSTKEIMKSKDAGIVRYCIDLAKKKLYVWNPELLHEYMAKQGEKEGYLEHDAYNLKDAVRNPYIWGVAKVINGKLEIDEGDEYNQSNIDWDILPKKLDKHGKDLSWLKDWWTLESYEDLST